MMKFYWDPKYSVNIKSIDTQHQKFFEIINQVFYILRQKPLDPDKLKQVITDLTNYAEFHLKYEEDRFAQTNYPEGEAHCRAHDTYRAKIKNYQQQIESPDNNISVLAREIAEFAQNWLSEHILATDTRYSQYFLLHDVE